jgi:dolichyl-phosphate-mannose--protein O-mannosyl transferase/Gpi18-like mannosyltransferase
MSSNARTAASAAGIGLPTWAKPIVIVLVVGFFIRLLFMPSLGFHNDVSAFEAWTLTLKDNPPWQFYAKTSFADYPPGYFIVLWILGGIYSLLGHLHLINDNDPAYFALRLIVKIPALIMDLVDATLIYVLVKRFASKSVALAGAALFALNPATIYVSAYWGQVDSVSWGFVLLALLLMLRSADEPAKTTSRMLWAWAAMAFSMLIKPQGALVGVILIAFAFVATDPAVRKKRLIATGLGLVLSLAMAYLVALLFHPVANPIAAFSWLLERYRIGSTVYPYNTVNAFNLYAVKQSFWSPDTTPLTLPFLNIPFGAMWMWGVVLVLAAAGLIVARYLQEKTEQAFLEGAMLLAFAFFILATRMHERYSFGAFLLAFPLLAFGRRRLWTIGILTFTQLANLIYSFAYQTVMETHPPGVDGTNIWGSGSHIISAINVALFFLAGYVYLGGSVGVMDTAEADFAQLGAKARAWFDPREGIVAMHRLDWIWAGLFSLGSFILCRLWLQYPDEKIFDEIYYARAGEEYLKHLEIFEFTHPPLTKLVVTLSMILHGGLATGDTGIGWRFLNVVVGALMVGVLYVFAKRITGSTIWAAVATSMLLFDGFHYVQSRIATPEITVAFFSLTTVYAFYRVWTASASRRASVPTLSAPNIALYAIFLAVGLPFAIAIAWALVSFGPHTRGFELRPAAFIVAFLYVEVLFYLAARWFAGRRAATAQTVSSYADGTRIVDGSIVPYAGGDVVPRTWSADKRMTYQAPTGAATFSPDGTMTAPGGATSGREMWLWIGLLAISSGCLAASKWNGLFDFFVVWLCVAAVVAQRFIKRPALFGNPFGMPLDVIVGVMLIVAGAIYTLCYIPFFTLGHNFLDMVALQKEMFDYHDHLVATHPYASSWWQWPILERPISYYYHDFRTGVAANDPSACCVAEILALPNPFVWWAGLLTVPLVGVFAWLERNRGYALLVIAYFLQWLPWIGSPRIAFEYHFFPNLAIIVLCNAIILQKMWLWRPVWNWQRQKTISGRAPEQPPAFLLWVTAFGPRIFVSAFVVVSIAAFFFFFPVLAGTHTSWQVWHDRMWFPRWII